MNKYILALATVIFLSTSTHAIEGTIQGIPWGGMCESQHCTNAFNYAKKGLYDKAREELFEVEKVLVSNVKKRKKLLSKDKNLASIYYNLGLISELEEDYETALDWYDRGTQARSKDLAKRFKLAPERISAQIIRKEAAERRAEKARLAAEKKAEEERLAEEQKAEAERLAAERKAEAEGLAAENEARAEMLAAEKKAQTCFPNNAHGQPG